jgi:photosystem II stability/assembly factor-like uncharacterized protein
MHTIRNKIKTCLVIFLVASSSCFAQNGWKICTTPVFGSRVDDIFMVNTQTGYAVCGDGKIVKTTNGGDNWVTLLQASGVYHRSVEFINAQKGFVGGFPVSGGTINIFRRTTDGGTTWTDLTALIDPRARSGICGLAVADANTIYGCGNWYENAGYIIKSVDGGNTWSFIDMSGYATSLIDMYFTSKDTGFVTGKGLLPLESAVILYTTNGGVSWTYKFQNSIFNEYCWKIQRLNKQIYFASIEDLTDVAPRILKSVDGGMTWEDQKVSTVPYNIEGIGFIDPLHGWTGGDIGKSFESKDGGITWDSINICPYMNRVFKVNDTMLFATGNQIWKYKGAGIYPPIPATHYAWMNCHPNPVRDMLSIEVAVAMPTHILLMLLDESGRQIKIIDNTDKPKGSYQYEVNTNFLSQGLYYMVLKTHEDKRVVKIVVSR